MDDHQLLLVVHVMNLELDVTQKIMDDGLQIQCNCSRSGNDWCKKVDGSDGDGDDDFVPQNFTSSVPSLLLYGL